MISITILISATLVFGPRDHELLAISKAVNSLGFPAELGVFPKGPDLGTSTRRVHLDETEASQSRDLLGRVLPDHWQYLAYRRRIGLAEINPGVWDELVIRFYPSSDHAKFGMLRTLTWGYQYTKWPKPGLPEITSSKTKHLGDRVWMLKTSSELSVACRVGLAVVTADYSGAKYGKQPRKDISAENYKKWEAYLAKVVAAVRKSSLQKPNS